MRAPGLPASIFARSNTTAPTPAQPAPAEKSNWLTLM